MKRCMLIGLLWEKLIWCKHHYIHHLWSQFLLPLMRSRHKNRRWVGSWYLFRHMFSLRCVWFRMIRPFQLLCLGIPQDLFYMALSVWGSLHQEAHCLVTPPFSKYLLNIKYSKCWCADQGIRQSQNFMSWWKETGMNGKKHGNPRGDIDQVKPWGGFGKKGMLGMYSEKRTGELWRTLEHKSKGSWCG